MTVSSLPEHEHVLVFAYPAMGHMIPLLNLSESLVERGCRITFVTTKDAADDLVKMWPRDQAVVTQPDQLKLRLLGVGSSTDRSGKNTTEQVWDNVIMLSANSTFVIDFALAEEALPDQVTGIESAWRRPKVAIGTGIASVPVEFCIQKGLRTLMLADTNATTMERIMGWEHEELTTQEWKVTGSDPTTYDVLVRDREGASPATPELHYSRGLKAGMTRAWKVSIDCAGVLLNTSEHLEPDAFARVRDVYAKFGVPCLAVGPLVHRASIHHGPKELASKLQPEVLDLLGRSGTGGTLFISFGSFLSPSKEHLRLFAAMLKRRRQPFVWSLRDFYGAVPPGFADEVEGFGVIVPWVDQRALLAHPGIGFVLSHMGWNTWLEALTFGKPVIGWPLGFDQLYNSELLVTWGLGVRFPAAVLFSTPAEVLDRPGVFATALDLTLDDALESPIGQAIRTRSEEMGIRLRNSLEKGGGATTAKDQVARFVQDQQ